MAQAAMTQAGAGAPMSYDIQPGPLAAALTRFAQQSGAAISIDAAKIEGLRTEGLHGTYATEDGFRLLLRGTGYTIGRTSAGYVLVPAPATASDAAPLLPPVDVNARRETAWGSVDGFVATRTTAGSKTDTPILDVPQTVNVVGRPQMEAQGSQSVTQAVRYVPGVTASFGDNDSRSDVLQSRGFYLRDYVDGIRVPFSAYSVSVPRMDPYGLERVEVLKGPASVLYGQGTPGGLLNMTTKRPTEETLREVQVQAGSYGRIQGAFDLSGPLTADGTFLYRLTGLARDSDAKVDDGYEKRQFIAPSLTWRPSQDTSLTLLSHAQHDDTISNYIPLPARGTLRGNPNGKLPPSRYSGEPGFDGFERDQYSLGYVFDHRFNQTFAMRQTVKYNDVKVDTRATPPYLLGADGRTLSRVASLGEGEASTLGIDTSGEATFATGALQHRTIIGFDYLRLEDDYRFSSNLTSAIDIYNPVYGATPVPALIPRFHHKQDMDQYGVYLQDQVRWRNWTATLGLRHDTADSTTRALMAGTQTVQKDSKLTWRAGLNYLFDNGIAPYASYSTSFEPLAGAAYDGAPFRPTTGRQFEVGARYQPPGMKSLVSVSAFDLLQQNVLTADPDPTHVGFSVQTGEVQVRGFEVEAKLNLMTGIDLMLAYALTDSEVTKDNRAAYLGQPLPRTSRHQASGWLDYTLQAGPLAGLGLGGGLRYVGTSYSDNTASLKIPAYTLVDAAVRYDLGRLSTTLAGLQLAVNASNLFDKEYVGYCGSDVQCFYGQGRTVIGTVKYRW